MIRQAMENLDAFGAGLTACVREREVSEHADQDHHHPENHKIKPAQRRRGQGFGHCAAAGWFLRGKRRKAVVHVTSPEHGNRVAPGPEEVINADW